MRGKETGNDIRPVVMGRKMGQHQVFKEGCPVCGEKFKGLVVGQMPPISVDPLFQVRGVIPLQQHGLVVIGLKERSMTPAEVAGYIPTGHPDVGKNTNIGPVKRYDEAVRIDAVWDPILSRVPPPTIR